MSIPFTWIYLIRDLHTGLYKIGRSDDPDKRLRELKHQPTILASPSEYVLLEAWLAPEAAEQVLHREYHRHRVRGEWFDFGKSRAEGRVLGAIGAWFYRCPRWVNGYECMEQLPGYPKLMKSSQGADNDEDTIDEFRQSRMSDLNLQKVDYEPISLGDLIDEYAVH